MLRTFAFLAALVSSCAAIGPLVPGLRVANPSSMKLHKPSAMSTAYVAPLSMGKVVHVPATAHVLIPDKVPLGLLAGLLNQGQTIFMALKSILVAWPLLPTAIVWQGESITRVVSNFTGEFAEFTRVVDTSASDFKQIALDFKQIAFGFLALSAAQVLALPISFCADEFRKVISKWFHNRPRDPKPPVCLFLFN
jgi:hypothetical protein